MTTLGTLYLIPSPISEHSISFASGDIKETINNTDYYLAENIRTARRYLSKLNISKSISSLHFEVLDKKTRSHDLEQLMVPIMEGKNVGVISEAGCPGVADPGALAVAYAHRKGIKVMPLVGPSSILLALMASGFNGQSFTFQGYLPIDKNERVKKIKMLEQQSVKTKHTQIFIETPYRNNQLLESFIQTCQKQTHLCIAKNIGHHEEEFISTRAISHWKKNKPELHKIPTVFLMNAYIHS